MHIHLIKVVFLKISFMYKNIIYSILLVSTLSSCTQPDEAILPMVGIYRAHILGVAGSFDLIISTDRNTNIYIEAPFDGNEWFLIKARVSNEEEYIKNINISNQDLDCCLKISGKGFFLDGTIEINYTLNDNGRKSNFKIIGTKL